jgi:single-strand DNA-binding protein
MPNDLNSFLVTGRVTREPDYKVTNNGKQLLRFTVAINYYTRQGSDYQNRPTFLPITVWGDYAERLAAKLYKGMQVTVNGVFNTSKYTGKDGKPKVMYNFVGKNVVYENVKSTEEISSETEYEEEF